MVVGRAGEGRGRERDGYGKERGRGKGGGRPHEPPRQTCTAVSRPLLTTLLGAPEGKKMTIKDAVTIT